MYYWQIISGEKYFTGGLSTAHLEVECDMISEVVSGSETLIHLLDNTVMKSKDQDIASDVSFTDDVVFLEHIIIEGKSVLLYNGVPF